MYLSGKALDNLKNVNDIIYIYEDSILSKKLPTEDFLKLKKKFLDIEIILLKTLNFELIFDLPHKFIDIYLKKLKTKQQIGSKEIEIELYKKSRSFADDSLRTRSM